MYLFEGETNKFYSSHDHPSPFSLNKSANKGTHSTEYKVTEMLARVAVVAENDKVPDVHAEVGCRPASLGCRHRLPRLKRDDAAVERKAPRRSNFCLRFVMIGESLRRALACVSASRRHLVRSENVGKGQFSAVHQNGMRRKRPRASRPVILRF